MATRAGIFSNKCGNVGGPVEGERIRPLARR